MVQVKSCRDKMQDKESPKLSIPIFSPDLFIIWQFKNFCSVFSTTFHQVWGHMNPAVLCDEVWMWERWTVFCLLSVHFLTAGEDCFLQRAHLSHPDILWGASSSHQTTHFSCQRGGRLVPLVRAFKRHTYVTSSSSDSFSSSQRTFAKQDCDMWRVPVLSVRCLSGKFYFKGHNQYQECVCGLCRDRCPASALGVKLLLINKVFSLWKIK